jgi:hypothetical protein
MGFQSGAVVGLVVDLEGVGVAMGSMPSTLTRERKIFKWNISK